MAEHRDEVDATQAAATAQAVALLHGEHEDEATAGQRLAERLTRFFARPLFVAFFTGLVVVWVSVNAIAVAEHIPAFDPPPCAWLQGFISLGALFMTVLILGTQRRAGVLADRRAQLTLEIAILGEQKTAKLIELLEELRRDHPEIVDRHDSQAHSMAKSANAVALLDAIKDTRKEITVDG